MVPPFSNYSLCRAMIFGSSCSGVSNMVMRSMFRGCLSWVLALGLCCTAPQGARAQSLIQSFFGNLFSGPASSGNQSTRPAQGAYGSYSGMGRYQFGGRGYYRTVCVRTCDGYYFPIRSSAYRRDFHDDAATCQARCGGGQLYYLPKHSGEVEHMLDLSGRRYDQLENAFLYRKQLVDGCTCRPMPWTAQERARHKQYLYEREFHRLAEEREKRLEEQIQAIARRGEDESTTAFSDPWRAASAEAQLPHHAAGTDVHAGFLGPDTPLSKELVASVQGIVPGSLTSGIDGQKPKRVVKRRHERRKSRRRVRAVTTSASPFNSTFIGWKSD